MIAGIVKLDADKTTQVNVALNSRKVSMVLSNLGIGDGLRFLIAAIFKKKVALVADITPPGTERLKIILKKRFW